MREFFGWILLALFGGLIIYFVSKKPTGTTVGATIKPGAKVAPTINNTTGTAATAAAAATGAASFVTALSRFFGGGIPPATGDNVTSADASTNIGDYPGLVDSNSGLVGTLPGVTNAVPMDVSSIYDSGFGLSALPPTLDTSIPVVADTTISTGDVSIYG